MERFRPLLSQTSNFLDPLMAGTNNEAQTIATQQLVITNTGQSSFKKENIPSQNNKDQRKITKRKNSNNENLFGGKIPYLKEWEIIFSCSDIKYIRQWSFDGELFTCRFRSICWKILLNIFPCDSTKWLSILRTKRESYETSRHQLMVTPGTTDQYLDPNLNNPLSQDEKSLWNQYFEDSELKRIIRMDVTRTFPEVDFFQSPRIQEMMVSILFCYARKYPETCYIQGMHEILAPLTFVLNFDHQAHKHSLMDCTTSNLLQELMDQAYLEHDSFTLFEVVMENLSSWYEDSDPKISLTPRARVLNTQPFARAQDIEPTTKIVKKLTRIHDELLKQHEPKVYAHLNHLEIAPQLYGIRWSRLMFGREFKFLDVLLVWDSIFADSYSNFLLIEYLIVALLSNIKEKLLVSDYVDSMKYLMRYPPSSNVQSVILMALHFRNPQIFPCPTRNVISSNLTIGGQPNIQRAPQFIAQEVHSPVHRSTSLPRHQVTNSNALKHRSTSVDQKLRSGSDGGRRKSSPSVETMDPLNVVTFKAYKDNLDIREPSEDFVPNGTLQKQLSENAANRVVSGLVRLGEKLGRPRDATPLPEQSEFLKDRPMDELKYMEKSAPISTLKKLLEGNGSSSSPSSDEETDPTFPQKKITGSLQKLSAEGLIMVTLSSALRLSHFQAILATRLSQLNIENDLTIRSAMEGISEVVETLKDIKENPRKSPVRKRYIECAHASSLPPERSAISHPLMEGSNDNDL